MEQLMMLATAHVTVEVEWLSMLVGTFIPLLVGLVTKLNASSGLKAIVNALLSAVAGFATVAIDAGGEFRLETAVVTILLTWVTSVATYYGLWKPTTTAQSVQAATAQVGIGSGHDTHRHRP